MAYRTVDYRRTMVSCANCREERNTSYCIIEKLPHGKNAKAIAKAVIRLLYAYKLTGVLTITTDNGSEFAAHQDITKGLNGVIVYFADSYCSWQKGLVENTNKLIRQYIPEGTDFSSITPHFIKKVQAKLNRRPRKKLNFSTPTIEFFKHFLNIAFALGLYALTTIRGLRLFLLMPLTNYQTFF